MRSSVSVHIVTLTGNSILGEVRTAIRWHFSKWQDIFPGNSYLECLLRSNAIRGFLVQKYRDDRSVALNGVARRRRHPPGGFKCISATVPKPSELISVALKTVINAKNWGSTAHK